MISADEAPRMSNVDMTSMLSSPKSPEEINKDRYHMLTGLCIEALCSQLVGYSVDDIGYCLSSIEAMLSTSFGREHLAQDKVCLKHIICLNALYLSKCSCSHRVQNPDPNVVL